jgi:hypothetical protein
MMLDHDPLILLAVYSSYFGSFLPGRPPVWLMVLGPPGCGKTKLLEFVGTNTKGVVRSKLSPAAFLSGYDKNLSLLTPDVDGKNLVIKDMSSMVTGRADRIEELTSQLRYLYDGELAPHTGRGLMTFTGKVGFLCACTPEIENRRAFLATLGDRFMYIKWRPYPDERKLLNYAMFRSGSANAGLVEANIHSITQSMVDTWKLNSPSFHSAVVPYIQDAAMVMVGLRSVVQRDHYTKELLGVPVVETPTRISQQFLRMCLAAQEFGATANVMGSLIRRFVYDSIPDLMRPLFHTLHAKSACTIKDLADACDVSSTTMCRRLQDLELTRALVRPAKGQPYTLPAIVRDAIQEWKA